MYFVSYVLPISLVFWIPFIGYLALKSSKKKIAQRFTKAYQRGKFSRKSGDDLYGFRNSLKDLKVKL